MSTVISVENISKSYHLGAINSKTFSNELALRWTRLRGKPNPFLKIGETDHGNRDGEEVWALKDINFKVEQGEVLGIIGKNGAGKSTLLKILSRVTAPTLGKIKVKGRIASLLEVGTGFHPELTGRENIYLNGAILGMTRKEIDSKLDEIIDFSGVEKYIDTPVKRYSSGMYVRLAFAVAAHLDPEILVVDEVLAVGDAEFQKKCLGKMGDVARQGRTVLFVSHNLGSVATLCSKSILLENGHMNYIDATQKIIDLYISKTQAASQAINQNEDAKNSEIWIKSIELEKISQNDKAETSLFVSIMCGASGAYPFNIEWHLHTASGQNLAFGSPQHFQKKVLFSKLGEFKLQFELFNMPLGEGKYFVDIDLTLAKRRFYFSLENAISFDVVVFDPDNIGVSYSPRGKNGSIVFTGDVYLAEDKTS